MSLEFILLGMLRQPASGYDLKSSFAEGYRHFWSAELSQIYPALQRMEERGWLSSRSESSPRGPDRRVYRRTAAGTKALHEWLQSEPMMGTERFAYLGQLIFLGELGNLTATLRFLQQLKERLNSFAKVLEAVEAEMRPSPESLGRLDDHEFHELLCLRVGVRSLRAKVAACDDGIELVQARHAHKKRSKRNSHV